MNIVFLGLALICALGGAFLVFDFFLWYFTGKVVAGTIEDFEKGKPIMAFKTEEGNNVSARAERIVHMGYFLAMPHQGDIFNTIYREQPDLQVRVHGYLHLVTGGVLLLPMLWYLAHEYGRLWLGGQVSFVATFAVLILGIWAALKLIRRNY
jgi:hypothetical protein